MKKIFGLMAAAAFVVAGSFGFASAAPGGECAGPVDLDCTVTDDEGNETYCGLFISLDSDADGCYNL